MQLAMLLLLVICIPLSTALADINSLREEQKKALTKLEQKYNELARRKYGRPDGTVDADNPGYKRLEERYRREANAVREKYKKLDPRVDELNKIKKDYKGKVDVSGSNPKDVRSDVDLTARSDDAAKELAQSWKDARHEVEYDPKTGKYVDKTTDTTLWEPSTPEREKARRADTDAYETMGGKKKAGVTGKEAMSDAWGNQVDNEKKFKHARENGDMKTQGKSVSKAAKNVGHDTKVTRQADDLRNYKSPDEAGITKLGESPEVKQKKIEQWQQKAETELKTTREKAVQKSQRQKEIRQKLADQVDKTSKNTLDPQNKGTGEEIRKRVDNLDKNNAEIARKKGLKAPSEPENTVKNDQKNDTNTKKQQPQGDSAQKTDKNAKKIDDFTKNKADGVDSQQKTTSPETETPKTTKKPETDLPNTKKAPKTPETDFPETQKAPKTPKADLPDAPDVPQKTRSVDVDTPGSSRAVKGVDAGGPSKTRSPGTAVDAPSTGSKAMGALDAAGDTLDAVDKVETYVEGATEGDPTKMTSVIVGNDTADRTRGKNAKKWVYEEDKAQQARGDEVRQELKAKLRRKGATATEAEAALQKRDAGDNKGFRDEVKKIKEKGIEDQAPRGLTPDGAIQEEDGMGERLTEGAKQAGEYGDAIYGGMISRTKKSVAERDELNREHDKTISTMKDEMDNEMVKKMMRKGVPFKDAREAVDRKNEGDPTKFNELRKQIQGKDDPGQSGSGLDASGRTTGYDYGDYADDAADNTKSGAENTKNRVIELGERPARIYKNYQDKKINEEQRRATGDQGEEVKNKLIGMGVDPDKAEKAGKDFANGKYATAKKMIQEQKEKHADELVTKHGANPDEAEKAADAWVHGDKKDSYGLRKKLAKEREEQNVTPPEDQDTSDDDWGPDEDWPGGSEDDDDWFSDDEDRAESSSNPLRNQEGKSEVGQDFDWKAGTGNDLLDQMIRKREDKEFEFTKKSMDFNKTQQDISDASVSSDGRVASAKQRVNSAQQDADGIRDDAVNKTVATDRDESWGSTIGDGVVDGITSGAASIGAAIASGINASVYGDKDRDDESSDDDGEAAPEEGAPQVAAAPPPAGGGSENIGEPAPPPVGGQAPAAAPPAQVASSGQTPPPQSSGGSAIAVSSGTSAPSRPAGSSTTTVKPPAKPTPKPQGKQCPYCGRYALKYVRSGQGMETGSMEGRWTEYHCSYCGHGICISDDVPGAWNAW